MGFIQELIDYFNASTQNKILCIVGAAVVLIILILIIAAIVHGAKKSKAKKKAAATAPAVSEPAEQPTSALDAAPSSSAYATPTEQETAEEPLPAEQTSDEGPLPPPLEGSSESNDFSSFGMTEEPESVAFAQQEPETAAEGPVTEETEPDAYDAAPRAEAADETPDEVSASEAVSPAENPDNAPEADAAVSENEEEAAQPEPVAETKAQKAPAAKTKQPAAATEKTESAPEEDRKIYTGKWVIRKNEEMGTYYFELLASNGEKLLSSIDYTSVAGARGGIKTHKANIAKGNFTIASSKSRQYFFRLLSGSKQILCTGETYKTKTRCENAIESVKRFAETAVIIVDKGEEQE